VLPFRVHRASAIYSPANLPDPYTAQINESGNLLSQKFGGAGVGTVVVAFCGAVVCVIASVGAVVIMGVVVVCSGTVGGVVVVCGGGVGGVVVVVVVGVAGGVVVGGNGGVVVVVVVVAIEISLTTRNPKNGLASDGSRVSLKAEDNTVGSESFQFPPRTPLRFDSDPSRSFHSETFPV